MNNELIPARFHLYWLGAEPGNLELECLRSVRSHHPHWDITIHCETSDDWQSVRPLAQLRTLDWLPSKIELLYHEAGSASLKSDIVRYAVLQEWGGVWLDMDVLMLKPINELRQSLGFVGSESFGVLGSAVIGSVPGHDVVCRAIDLIKDWLDPRDRLSIGPRLLTRAVLDCGANWTILEPEAFYPWRWSQVGRFPIRNELIDSYAVHLCSSLGATQELMLRKIIEILASSEEKHE